MQREEISFEVTAALNRIKDAVIHPERRPCGSCYQCRIGLPKRCEAKCQPLAPAQRLAAGLTVLLMVKEWSHTFLKEILSDTEAIEAAKQPACDDCGRLDGHHDASCFYHGPY